MAAPVLRKELQQFSHLPADFCKLADAYGIRALRVETKAEVPLAIREARAHKGPILLDFQIDQEENVWPMVPAGAALSETVEAPAEELLR